jgi:hypothetical protein
LNEFLWYTFIGSAGAGAVELLKVYELRGKLDQKRYRSLLKSGTFWLAVMGMLSASGFLAWAFYAQSTPPPTPWQLIMASVAARSFMRTSIEANVANARQTLGGESILKDAFR